MWGWALSIVAGALIFSRRPEPVETDDGGEEVEEYEEPETVDVALLQAENRRLKAQSRRVIERSARLRASLRTKPGNPSPPKEEPATASAPQTAAADPASEPADLEPAGVPAGVPGE